MEVQTYDFANDKGNGPKSDRRGVEGRADPSRGPACCPCGNVRDLPPKKLATVRPVGHRPRRTGRPGRAFRRRRPARHRRARAGCRMPRRQTFDSAGRAVRVLRPRYRSRPIARRPRSDRHTGSRAWRRHHHAITEKVVVGTRWRAEYGEPVYRLTEASAQWSTHQFLGRFVPVIYVLRKQGSHRLVITTTRRPRSRRPHPQRP